jgi:hypothetical protein
VVETFVDSARSSSTVLLLFLTIFLLQQPLHSGCCLYWLGLFTDLFCHLLPLCVAFRKTRFFYGSFGIIVEAITYCLYLLFFCLFYLGSIVRVPTLLWLFNPL